MTVTGAAHTGGGAQQSAPPALPQDVVITDVTLRDGGYLNGHSWTPAQRREVVSAVAAAGVKRIEVGYVDGAGPVEVRRSGIATEAIRELAERTDDVHVVVMARTTDRAPDLAAVGAAGVRTVRLPTSVNTVTALRDVVARATDAGLHTVVNLIRTSSETLASLLRAGSEAVSMGADALCVADSNGSLLPTSVGRIVRSLCAELPVPIGIHTHDNLGLAFANALAGLAAGATHVDASCRGIGKGGGNLELERLLAYLQGLGRRDLQVAALEPVGTTVDKELGIKRDQATAAQIAALGDLDYEQALGLQGLSEAASWARSLSGSTKRRADTIWALQRAHFPFGD
ncbi:hypothetical protein ACIHEJ_33175 [Streptomyces sp. NPDC052301]|uniref:hypothetical protein n=1 Tax=Streptomyces sp. NPDC052301 TaxID=3365687 RepID=UPI0037D44F37